MHLIVRSTPSGATGHHASYSQSPGSGRLQHYIVFIGKGMIVKCVARGVAKKSVGLFLLIFAWSLFVLPAGASADVYEIKLDKPVPIYCPNEKITVTFKADPSLHKGSYIELHGPSSPDPGNHGYFYAWHTIGDDTSGTLPPFYAPTSSAGVDGPSLTVTTEFWFTMYDYQALGGPNPAEKVMSSTFSVDPNCT
jgi:hypothetical protein